MFMNKFRSKFAIAICAISAFFLSSCTEEKGGLVDGTISPPVLLQSSIAHSIVNLDSTLPGVVVPLPDGMFEIRTSGFAVAIDRDGSGELTKLAFYVHAPGSNSIVASGNLPLTRTYGDTAEFAGAISFSLRRTDFGLFRIEFLAFDQTGLRSLSVRHPLLITRANSRPILGTPFFRHFTPGGSDSTRLTVSISVSDSNGVADINLVSVRALNSNDSTTQPMFDDGLAIHGDVFPGDGIYSAIFWTQPVGSLQNVTLEFHALDRNGAESTPVRRTLQNSPPTITRLSVPDSIQRPTTGFRLIHFFAEVFDPDGLGDVDSVYFVNMSSQNPAPFLMYDDGSCCPVPPENLPSGDSTASDGTYSRTVRVDASTTIGDKEFHFHAVDRAGARHLVIRIIRIYQ